jgi:hypothetical protein
MDKTTASAAQLYAMSKFASKKDRDDAINRDIDRLAKKRDFAADVSGNVFLAWTYQEDIDALAALLDSPGHA